MFDRFTERARKVMSLARLEAQRFHNEYVGSEHILLALVKEGTGVASVVLKKMGVELKEMESHGKTQYCCGGGAGVMLIERAAPLRKRAFDIKMRQVEETGADAVVTSCESCRMNFSIGAENANWDKQVKSLVEMVAQNLGENLAGDKS